MQGNIQIYHFDVDTVYRYCVLSQLVKRRVMRNFELRLWLVLDV